MPRVPFLVYLGIVGFLGLLDPQQALGQPNLLTNAGFEEAGGDGLARGWGSHCTGGSTAGRDTSVSHTGGACGHIVKVADGASHVAALVFPRVDVTGGQEYTLSGWGRSHVPSGQAVLFMYQYAADGSWLGCFFSSPVATDTQVWTPLHFTGRVEPNCAWVQVRFEIYGEAAHGEAWVDDVYFGQDTTPPGPVGELSADTDGTTARLAWTAPPDVDVAGYVIFRSPYPRFARNLRAHVGFTTDTRFEEPLPPGYAFHYAVSAVDGALNPSVPVSSSLLRSTQAGDMPTLAAWTAGPGKRWGPELPLPLPEQTDAHLIDAARGEVVDLQVLVGAPRESLRGVTVTVGELKGPGGALLPADAVTVLIQEYVELVAQARWVPDALPPATAVDIGPGLLRGWWVTLSVPTDAVEGDYRGAITVRADGLAPVTLPLVVRVWPVTVPRENHYGGSWGVWGTQIAEQEQVALGSTEYQRLYRRYLDFFLERRMVPRELPGPVDSPETEEWLNDERVSSFIISTPAGWGNIMTPEQVVQFREQCDRLRARGWLHKGYVYNFDEPDERAYAHCVEMAARIREAGRDIQILLTEQPEEALLGAVDIWCPILPEYARTRDLCRARQQQGEHVWWYVCCGPGGPWPNYMLTNAPIDARVLSWMQAAEGVEGELYWAVTCFPGDVWARGLPEIFPGDGYLCYPGRPRGIDGPVSSIRAEVIRAAKQDIELIWLLRQLAAAHGRTARVEEVLAQAFARVFTDFTHFTKSDEDIAAARRMVLQEIVGLTQEGARKAP